VSAVATATCACGAELAPNHAPGHPRKWCSERCRRRTLYTGSCVDCGKETYNGNATPPERCSSCANRARAIWDKESIADLIQAWVEMYGAPPAATDWNPNLARKYGLPERAERFYADGCWPVISTVLDVFGSWNAALEAAGFTPRSPGTYGRPGEDMGVCREIRARYEAGESTIALGRAYGVASPTINYRIRKAGGRLRSLAEATALRYAA
jgi:hypothetical protein